MTCPPLVVSIITVSYNSSKTIEKTIQSVLNQTYAHIEYVVIDGGSSDGTVDIIKRYSSRIATWVSEPDRGIYDAMNKGISLATGYCVGLLNSDDWLEPDSVQLLVDTFRETSCDFTFGDVYLADADGTRFGVMKATGVEPKSPNFLYQMPFPHQSCYVRRAVLEKMDPYSLTYRLSSDHEFTIRLIRSGAVGARLPKPIASYRMGGSSGGIATFRESRDIAIKHGMGRVEAGYRYYRSLMILLCLRVMPRSLIRLLLRFKRSRHVWY